MLLDAARSALLLIDHQEKLMPAMDGGEATAREAARLAAAARVLGVPVLATLQNPERLGPPVPVLAEFMAGAWPKTCFDARLGAPLDAALGERTQLVLTGWEAHVCVLQTAFGLLATGREVFVAADACASRVPASKAAALERLAHAGASIVTAEMAIFEWARDAAHPRFKDILKLVK